MKKHLKLSAKSLTSNYNPTEYRRDDENTSSSRCLAAFLMIQGFFPQFSSFLGPKYIRINAFEHLLFLMPQIKL